MATEVCTPERVQKLLASFVYKTEHKGLDEGITKNGMQANGNVEQENGRDIRVHPTDRASFLERLRTYTSLKWYAKPLFLSPPQCAHYGWENSAQDVLHCVSCDSHLSGHIPSTLDPSRRKECCVRLASSLRTAHDVCCPWSSNPCAPDCMGIGLDNTNKALESFRDAVNDMAHSLSANLPMLNQEVLEGLDLGSFMHALISLRSDANCDSDGDGNDEDDDDLYPVTQASSVLVMCGWQRAHDSTQLLHCDYCSRDVGLWNYHQLAGGESGHLSDSEEEMTLNTSPDPVQDSAPDANDHVVSMDGGESDLQHTPETENPDIVNDQDSSTSGPQVNIDDDKHVDPENEQQEDPVCINGQLSSATEAGSSFPEITTENNSVAFSLMEDGNVSSPPSMIVFPDTEPLMCVDDNIPIDDEAVADFMKMDDDIPCLPDDLMMPEDPESEDVNMMNNPDIDPEENGSDRKIPTTIYPEQRSDSSGPESDQLQMDNLEKVDDEVPKQTQDAEIDTDMVSSTEQPSEVIKSSDQRDANEQEPGRPPVQSLTSKKLERLVQRLAEKVGGKDHKDNTSEDGEGSNCAKENLVDPDDKIASLESHCDKDVNGSNPETENDSEAIENAEKDGSEKKNIDNSVSVLKGENNMKPDEAMPDTDTSGDNKEVESSQSEAISSPGTTMVTGDEKPDVPKAANDERDKNDEKSTNDSGTPVDTNTEENIHNSDSNRLHTEECDKVDNESAKTLTLESGETLAKSGETLATSDEMLAKSDEMLAKSDETSAKSSETLANDDRSLAVSDRKRGLCAVEGDRPVKKRKKIRVVRTYFHPLAEHRPWCAWVYGGCGIRGTDDNAHSSDTSNVQHIDLPMPGDTVCRVPGWRYMLGLLLPTLSPDKRNSEHLTKSTPSRQSLRNIRKIFRDWTSPSNS